MARTGRTELIISDHAILRYPERVKNIDIEAIRNEMASPGIIAAVEFGCRSVKMGNGSTMVLRANRIVTVLPKGGHLRRDIHDGE